MDAVLVLCVCIFNFVNFVCVCVCVCVHSWTVQSNMIFVYDLIIICCAALAVKKRREKMNVQETAVGGSERGNAVAVKL